MTDEARIEKLLADLKAEWLVCPIHWHEFHSLLVRLKPADAANPPVPLILAASAESAASKHSRLAMQLRWANACGKLNEALDFLLGLQPSEWEQSSASDWNMDHYTSF